jgi:hypothetical protein
MNSYKKFVFSRGGASEALAWNNAEFVVAPTDEDVVRFINELKTQPGRDIHLAGGAAPLRWGQTINQRTGSAPAHPEPGTRLLEAR